MKLKNLIKESWLEEKKTLTKEEKTIFLEKVKRFNEFSKRIFRQENITNVAKELAELAKMAEVLTLSEVDENFDKITVERNMKEIKNLSTGFQKSAQESHVLENRMKGLYDDLGKLLERYYEVDELNEDMPDQHVEKGQGLKPYDGWKANDFGGQPKEPKQSIEERKKKRK